MNEWQKVFELAKKVCAYAAERGGMTRQLLDCVENAASKAGMFFGEDEEFFMVEDEVFSKEVKQNG